MKAQAIGPNGNKPNPQIKEEQNGERLNRNDF